MVESKLVDGVGGGDGGGGKFRVTGKRMWVMTEGFFQRYKECLFGRKRKALVEKKKENRKVKNKVKRRH